MGQSYTVSRTTLCPTAQSPKCGIWAQVRYLA